MTPFWNFATWLARLPLLFATGFFLFLASRWLLDPVETAARYGIVAGAADGLADLRGNGAVFVALSAVMAACLVSARRVLPGLQLLTGIVGVTLATRAVILVYAGITPLSLRITGFELLFLAVAAAGLLLERSRLRREASAAPRALHGHGSVA